MCYGTITTYVLLTINQATLTGSFDHVLPRRRIGSPLRPALERSPLKLSASLQAADTYGVLYQPSTLVNFRRANALHEEKRFQTAAVVPEYEMRNTHGLIERNLSNLCVRD
jgi:hypothetical protein